MTQLNSTRKDAFLLQPFHRGWIRWVLVHVDDARQGIARRIQALRKKRWAAAASRLAVSRKSIVWPVETTARYKYLSLPFTFI